MSKIIVKNGSDYIINNAIKRKRLWMEIKKNRLIYLLLAPAVCLVLLFSYAPLPGIKIAFQNYNIFKPEISKWVGLENFIGLFSSSEAHIAIMHTFYISTLNLIICFPAPIIFALLINEFKNGIFKRSIQTISYLPYFLSWISVIGIVTSMYAKAGPINDLITLITGNQNRTMFLAQPSFFVPNIIILSLWKGLGWGSIIYLSAISGVDPSLYEAAIIDGAGRLKQTWYVTLPTILPTIVIMLIWSVGALFGDNFELIYGLQNPFVNFEVIQTIIYKQGIEGGNYKMTTAFGLMQGVVNLSLLYMANLFAKKTTDISIF